jgi:hypothetical protein
MHDFSSRLSFACLFAALFVSGVAAALPDGADILIRDGTIIATAADYEMDGTMWTMLTRLEDSSTYTYRSTDHGLSWQYRLVSRASGRIFDKLGLVVGEGESSFVYTFVLDPVNNGDLWLARLDTRTDSLLSIPVLSGPDTIRDFAVCRDYTGANYWLYAVVTAPDSNSQRALRFLRSTDYGRDWSVTDSYPEWHEDPHLSAGAGAYIYFSGHRPDALKMWTNYHYLDHGQWAWTLFNLGEGVADPVIGAAFTLPESTASAWCVWSEDYQNSGDWDVKYCYSTSGGDNWSLPQYLAASTDADEGYPDLRNYTSLGNTYINASYIRDVGTDRTVYRRYANAPTPTGWSDTLRINQGSAGTGTNVRPKLCYTPGGPFSGAGCVFVGEGLNGCWWNGPYPGNVAESKDAAGRLMSIQPSIGCGPFLIKAGSPTAVLVHDRAGRLVRSLEPDRSGTANWDGHDDMGRAVASGVYFVRLTAGDRRATEKVVLHR